MGHHGASADDTTFTNVNTISGPSSGTGLLTITGGTATGGVVQTIGSSSGTGYNQMIGSQSGSGVSQVIGGTNATSFSGLLPDSSLPQSGFYCNVSAGGGTGLGQTACNITATTDSLGYFNPIPTRMAVRNAQSSPNATTTIFESGAEGCIDSSGKYTTATCGFSLPLHWYWWVFNSPTVGYTAMDYRPGPGTSPSSWTADKSQWIYYSPVAIQAPTAVNTIGGGASSSTTFSAGAGSGTSSNLTCAPNHNCTAIHGTVVFTTGSLVNGAQPLFTISSTVNGASLTRTAVPDCTGYVTDFNGHTGMLIFSTSTTASQAAYSSITLSNSAAFTAVYTCMGN